MSGLRRRLGPYAAVVAAVVVALICVRSLRGTPAWMAVLLTLPIPLLVGAIVWAFVARGPSAFSGLGLTGRRAPPDKTDQESE